MTDLETSSDELEFLMSSHAADENDNGAETKDMELEELPKKKRESTITLSDMYRASTQAEKCKVQTRRRRANSVIVHGSAGTRSLVFLMTKNRIQQV